MGLKRHFSQHLFPKKAMLAATKTKILVNPLHQPAKKTQKTPEIFNSIQEFFLY